MNSEPQPSGGARVSAERLGDQGNGYDFSAHPYSERVLGYRHFDAVPYKNFAAVHGQSLSFRVEAFKLFNVAIDKNPVATME